MLLALVTLTPSCEVDAVFTGAREYARPTHISQVQPFSFEGEKDIDKDNPKRLRFNINGVPASVRLYLWGDRLSTLYYTELGQHSHSFDKPTEPASKYDEHWHELSNHTHNLPAANVHNHRIRQAYGSTLGVPAPSGADVATAGSPHPRYAYSDQNDPNAQFIEQTAVTFQQPTAVPSPNTSTGVKHDAAELHRHQIPATSPFGATDFGARGPHENSYGFLNDLRVSLRVGLVTTDITPAILTQLHWTSLGTGHQNDLLNTDGTGEIDLLAIANEKKIDLSLPNTYELTFSVADGGGKVAYNLFVA